MCASDVSCSFPSWWVPNHNHKRAILLFCPDPFPRPIRAWPVVGQGRPFLSLDPLDSSLLFINALHPEGAVHYVCLVHRLLVSGCLHLR